MDKTIRLIKWQRITIGALLAALLITALSASYSRSLVRHYQDSEALWKQSPYSQPTASEPAALKAVKEETSAIEERAARIRVAPLRQPIGWSPDRTLYGLPCGHIIDPGPPGSDPASWRCDLCSKERKKKAAGDVR